jgi:hypothetical protein
MGMYPDPYTRLLVEVKPETAITFPLGRKLVRSTCIIAVPKDDQGGRMDGAVYTSL